MTNTDLFGMTEEQKPRRFPVSTIGTARHRKCTYEEKSILTSALIKYLRLSDEPRSLEVFWRMKVVGVPDSYIVHRLCAFAWEDAEDDRALLFATALKTTGMEDIDNAMQRTILALCRCSKFWQSRQGADDEAKRIAIRECVKEEAKKGKLVIDDFPDFVKDRFTMQGRDLAKAGVKLNERFSGVIRGGCNLRAETIVYGAPSPDKPSLFDTDAVRESAEANQSVDQYLEERGMTVEEWKNTLQKTIN